MPTSRPEEIRPEVKPITSMQTNTAVVDWYNAGPKTVRFVNTIHHVI